MKFTKKFLKSLFILFTVLMVQCVPDVIVKASSCQRLSFSENLGCDITGRFLFENIQVLIPENGAGKKGGPNEREGRGPGNEPGQPNDAPKREEKPEEKKKEKKPDSENKPKHEEAVPADPVQENQENQENYIQQDDFVPEENAFQEQETAEPQPDETSLPVETTVIETTCTPAAVSTAEKTVLQQADSQTVTTVCQSETVTETTEAVKESSFNTGFMTAVTIISLVVFILLSGIFVVWLQKMI